MEEVVFNNEIRANINGGYLKAHVSEDPNYPGIHVDLVRDNEPEEALSKPTILIIQMKETKKVRVLIWNDPNEEAYTDEIVFKEINEK